MKTYDNDILASRNELKNMPYSVPEGYFDSFKAGMSMSRRQERPARWRGVVPYIAVAASLTLLLTLGVTLSGSLEKEDITPEDYILFSDNLINTSVYEASAYDQTAEAELEDEEIVEYLIYAGVTPEMIELAK